MSTKLKAFTAVGTALLAPLATVPAAHAADAHSAAPTTTTNAKPCAATASLTAATHTAASPTPVTSIRSLAGGGKAYTYRLGTQQLRFGVAPAEFDALHASQQALALYGLPPRPSGGAQLAKWNQDFGHLGQAVAPEISIGPARPDNIAQVAAPTAAPAGAQGGVTTGSTSIWSGYVSKQWGQPTYYGDAEGTWIQPSVGTTSCSGATHLTWVGIGGYGSSQLLQDGTDQNNNAWFEYLGANGTGVSITDFSSQLGIRPGDTIQALTWYINGTAYWTVQDETSGKYTTANLANASAYYDGSSAEFIDERTTFGTTPSPLANYGATHWTAASAATSTNWKNQVPLSSLPNVTQLSIVNPNTTHTLAIPLNEGFAGYAFSTDWKNCS